MCPQLPPAVWLFAGEGHLSWYMSPWLQPSSSVFAFSVLAKAVINTYGLNWSFPALYDHSGALIAGTSKTSHDSSALDDFMVAGATAGSSPGRWQNETGYVLPAKLPAKFVSRRGHHRWPETLPVLLPLSLWRASTVAGAALGKHMALPKVVQSYRSSVVPSRLVVTLLQPLRPPRLKQRAGQMLWTTDPQTSLGG